MRAVEISMLVFLLGVGLSVAGQLGGPVTGYTTGVGSISQGDVEAAAQVSAQSNGLMGTILNAPSMLARYINIFLRIIWGSAMIGDTLASLAQPYPVPSVLVYGLDAMGLASIVILVNEYVLNRGMRGYE